MKDTRITDSLKKAPLFEGLPARDLERIAQKTKIRQFFPEEIIVFQGQPSNSLFVITNGIVAVKNITHEQENVLAYLMPGNTFGEVGILENQPRSATVTALSEVDLLVIQREDFLHILQQYPNVAIQLSRILGRYLIDANKRLAQDDKQLQMIVLFNLSPDAGGTAISSILAHQLAKHEKRPTAYVECRTDEAVLEQLKSPAGASTYHHPAGYDIILPQEDGFLPSITRMTLLLDKLRNTYDNIVVSFPGELDEPAALFLDDARQVLLLTSPTDDARTKLTKLEAQLRTRIKPGETSIFTLLNRAQSKYAGQEMTPPADFEIPYLPDFEGFVPPKRDRITVPEQIAEVVDTCIERLERTHSVGVFIPSTMDVDVTIDPEQYVGQTLNFLAERFGGATSREANGVWLSEAAGLVGEQVHIVESYMSQTDLNRYLDEVVAYVKHLKHTLRQEAMALEVDRKLTLI
ncbi:MAG: cyclic nucleotide-binding domain-containing protein [Bacteroidia bacterium]